MTPDERFAIQLSDLITDAKAEGADLGEMIAEMEGVVDGLKHELADEEEDV